ncbi:MAG: metal-dependent transcriptional regulator [Candidatus Thorarchaeota archaeon]
MTTRTEDYLRVLDEIIEEKGYARIKDIAERLGVRSSSVVEMMKKMSQMDLVRYEKYGGVRLTSSGQERADAVRKRHDTFMNLLELIMVPQNIALKDAHILEHNLHPKTVVQFSKLVEFITSQSELSECMSVWSQHFGKKPAKKKNGVRKR